MYLQANHPLSAQLPPTEETATVVIFILVVGIFEIVIKNPYCREFPFIKPVSIYDLSAIVSVRLLSYQKALHFTSTATNWHRITS